MGDGVLSDTQIFFRAKIPDDTTKSNYHKCTRKMETGDSTVKCVRLRGEIARKEQALDKEQAAVAQRWHEEARQRGAFLTSGDWNDVRDSRREVEEDVVSSGGNKDRLKLDRDRQGAAALFDSPGGGGVAGSDKPTKDPALRLTHWTETGLPTPARRDLDRAQYAAVFRERGGPIGVFGSRRSFRL
eukprot:CAMPEP_0198702920 /NCGR_PEP_ID=MMETSP1468-20131203/389040_1 /TAXON_ID=1461545 /ORGANISM="Mantoniella sp, Strain CCMP1436" /LENGTH=185 /DNA_ID=CAMNT_0044461533 /DNA_START=1128 /DNA_END=1685 /DNA_ORIENTATION=+